MVWKHNDFMLSSFKQVMPFLQNIHDGYKFFILNLVIIFCKRKLTRTKVNKMKKIFFYKLWEHNTYCKVESVCLQNKRFGRVYINQTWGGCERSLQRLKGIINFNSLRNKLIFFSQPNKRGHYWRIMGNETSIKVDKSKKTLDILNKG
jgi:hypothetical protein